MNTPHFYDVDEIEQLAINAFYGFGYDFYQAENQLRATDQKVREAASGLLATARAGLDAAEAAYRRAALPPPSRDKPRPDPAAVANAQDLERLGRDLGALEGAIRALPVPKTDRMTQLFRDERATLERLIAADQRLIGHAEAIRRALGQVGGDAVLAVVPQVAAHIAALQAAIQERRDLLA
jgi:hypothetical protein